MSASERGDRRAAVGPDGARRALDAADVARPRLDEVGGLFAR